MYGQFICIFYSMQRLCDIDFALNFNRSAFTSVFISNCIFIAMIFECVRVWHGSKDIILLARLNETNLVSHPVNVSHNSDMKFNAH